MISASAAASPPVMSSIRSWRARSVAQPSSRGISAASTQQPEVAAEQVFRRPGWPAPLPVPLGPGVQALPVLLQARRPESSGGGDLEFLMAQHVDRRRGAGLPVAGPAGEGPPGHRAQVLLDVIHRQPGQLG